jgi:hypothetical protein
MGAQGTGRQQSAKNAVDMGVIDMLGNIHEDGERLVPALATYDAALEAIDSDGEFDTSRCGGGGEEEGGGGAGRGRGGRGRGRGGRRKREGGAQEEGGGGAGRGRGRGEGMAGRCQEEGGEGFRGPESPYPPARPPDPPARLAPGPRPPSSRPCFACSLAWH